MNRHQLTLFSILFSYNLYGLVDDVTGDTGSAQTGSLMISGGTSGGSFDSTSTTITQNFSFLSLPLTNSTDGQIIISSEPVLHSFGSGNLNIFVGSFAGNFSTTAFGSTGCGANTLNAVTTGSFNTAVGHSTLQSVTTGVSNTAIGDSAGSALVDGNNNTLIGAGAGTAYTSNETYNIILGNNTGIIGESNTIRIGAGQQQTDCYIDGIYSSTVDSDTGLTVFIDVNGKLGTIVSSAKYKENIRDIDDDSMPIMHLRPISFNLKSDKVKQFGLLAEEVLTEMPDLVVKDKQGDPYAVRYHELPVLLLNELQKTVKHIEKLEKRLNKMAARIKKLEAEIEVAKSE